MHHSNFFSYSIFAVAALSPLPSASAADILTGDTRLACEAVLCLASGSRPDECSPSLQRYFSISHRRLTETIKARGNFLKLCPASNQTPEMEALVNAMAGGAGRCDADSLNMVLTIWQAENGSIGISNQMPSYCAVYTGHSYTNFSGAVPRYIGTPEGGGYWVEAGAYEAAQIEYRVRIKAEDEAGAEANCCRYLN
jgi:hypothetical protein